MNAPRRRSFDAALPDEEPAAPPLRWPLEALWAQLEPLRPGLHVDLLLETDSTSTRLLDRARAGDVSPCLLVAERQTAGRGRLGREWLGDPRPAPGGGPSSLCLSIGLPFGRADGSGLSLALGVALAEALHPSVRLKWPNDLWLLDADGSGRKLGGVLIETIAIDASTRFVVIGIGINLVAPAHRPALAYPTAGWQEIEPRDRAPELLMRIAPPVLIALATFEAQGFAAFASRFAARDALCGRTVETSEPQAARGLAEGVDNGGALRILTPSGLRLVSSGEVSVRPC